MKPENILFLDIETVPGGKSLEEMPLSVQTVWEEKFKQFKSRNPDRYPDELSPSQGFEREAGIFAEFGKVVCVSVGHIVFQDGKKIFRVKSFKGHDERLLLAEVAQMLTNWGDKSTRTICGHNVKEFDIPFLCRRMIIKDIVIPEIINVAGKKPWEVRFLDTMELWKFGDFKHYSSLKLLTAVLGIPSPKDDIDGSMVGKVYYETGDVDRIAVYCEKDVLATAQVYLKLNGLELLDPDIVAHVE